LRNSLEGLSKIKALLRLSLLFLPFVAGGIVRDTAFLSLSVGKRLDQAVPLCDLKLGERMDIQVSISWIVAEFIVEIDAIEFASS
jgi:hypothetical protein